MSKYGIDKKKFGIALEMLLAITKVDSSHKSDLDIALFFFPTIMLQHSVC